MKTKKRLRQLEAEIDELDLRFRELQRIATPPDHPFNAVESIPFVKHHDADTTDIHIGPAEPTTRYVLPPAPLTGRVVKVHRRLPDDTGNSPGLMMFFRRRPDGTWQHVQVDGGRWAADPDDDWEYSWLEILGLDVFEPAELVPLSDVEQEDERLYGPSHARWGDPYQPCPWFHTEAGQTTFCAMGVEHTGPHKDATGNPLGQTVASGVAYDNAAGLAVARDTPCTCGRPDRHQPGCPRFAQVSGAATPDPWAPTQLCGATDGDGTECFLVEGHTGPHGEEPPF